MIARSVHQTLTELKLRYPAIDPALAGLKVT
jgi:hypothetical protein